MMFSPSTQISPASGRIKPTRCLSNTLLPPPLRPMIASVPPRSTSRSTPRKISCAPMRFTRLRTVTIDPFASSVEAAVLGGKIAAPSLMRGQLPQSHLETATHQPLQQSPRARPPPQRNSIFRCSFHCCEECDQKTPVAKSLFRETQLASVHGSKHRGQILRHRERTDAGDLASACIGRRRCCDQRRGDNTCEMFLEYSSS